MSVDGRQPCRHVTITNHAPDGHGANTEKRHEQTIRQLYDHEPVQQVRVTHPQSVASVRRQNPADVQCVRQSRKKGGSETVTTPTRRTATAQKGGENEDDQHWNNGG
jgi:hypothetical protein